MNAHCIATTTETRVNGGGLLGLTLTCTCGWYASHRRDSDSLSKGQIIQVHAQFSDHIAQFEPMPGVVIVERGETVATTFVGEVDADQVRAALGQADGPLPPHAAYFVAPDADAEPTLWQVNLTYPSHPRSVIRRLDVPMIVWNAALRGLGFDMTAVR